MRPPKRGKIEYERIKVYDEWINGVIEEVKLEEDRLTGFKDDETGQPKRSDMIRFKFKLENHEYPHYSRWMSYSFGEKSNLFLKYLKFLVNDAQPDMDIDLDNFKGFKIKTMWVANGEYDNLEQIRPISNKLVASTPPVKKTTKAKDIEDEDEGVDVEPEDIPF